MAKKKVIDELRKNIPAIAGQKKDYVEAFYCYQKEYHFSLPVLDENGKTVYKFDSNNNKRHDQPATKTYVFERLPVIDELSKKIKADEFESWFAVKEGMEQKEQLLAYLRDKSSARNCVASKIVTEEEYIRRKNPLVFETSVKHDAEKDALQKRIDDLEAQLKNRK